MRIFASGRSRTLAALALCFAAALAAGSCSLFKRDVAPPPPFKAEPTGTDLAVSARFVTAEDDVSGFFKKAMPDSGVIPVRVAVRNDGSRSLVIHSANGMKIAPGFEGFALAARGVTYPAMHPKSVVMELLSEKKADRYKSHSVGMWVLSMFIPPVTVYWGYNEVDIGRFYRPLFSNSFYPAREDGLLEPVRLAPGAERQGYLYFALPKGTPRDSCELLVRGCVAAAITDTLRGSGFLFPRDELPLTETALRAAASPGIPDHASASSCDAPYGYLLALGTGEEGKQVLKLARVRALNPKSDSLWTVVTPISAASASIADASCLGSLAAVGINFKSKSRVYLFQCADAPQVFKEQGFSRGIRRVFMSTAGVYIVTDDGVCHTYDGATGTCRHGVKLGTDVDETALAGDRMLSFLGKKEVWAFAPSEGAALSVSEKRPIPSRGRRVLGLVGGDLALMNKTKAVRGDEIWFLKIDGLSGADGGPLAGKLAAAATTDSSLVAQLADGTLIRLARGPEGSFGISEAGYLPFLARALKAARHGFIAVGERGEFVVGGIDEWTPGAAGAVETSVRVR